MDSTLETVRQLKSRQFWLCRRVDGARALLVLVIVGLVLLMKALDWRWWSVLGGFLLLGGLGTPLVRATAMWGKKARTARARWLYTAAWLDDRPPVLLLRSFRSAVTLEPVTTVRMFGRERPMDEETSPAAPRSHLLRIASHVRSHGPVVAIGRARRGLAAAVRVDVLMLEPRDDDWFEVFEILASASRAILLLPGESVSVTKEFQSLRSKGLLTRLVIVMPPFRRLVMGRWRLRMPFTDDHLDLLRSGWETAREHFERDVGISLPPYDPRGLAFGLDPEGRARERVSLEGSFVFLRRAVETIVPRETTAGEPLERVMERIARFDLAPRPE